MTYKPPDVEEYPETDETTKASKRKRSDKLPELPTSQESEDKKEQPPSKVPKPSEKPAEDNEQDAEEEEDERKYNDDFEQGEGEEGEGDVGDLGEDEEVEPDEEENDESKEIQVDEVKIQKAIEEFGRAPLGGTAIADKPLSASPETVFAMILDAMLKSRPISHDLSQRAVSKLIDVGYHDIRKLGKSSWEERTKVLEDGGYRRYKEQGATNLGELAEFVDEKYDGDLNNLWDKAHHERAKARELVKEIKGLGDLGVDLFFNNVQSVWPSIAPFVDGRSLKTADEVGIGTDLDVIYAELKKDSMKMSRLANGLSAIRLEKRQGEFLEV